MSFLGIAQGAQFASSTVQTLIKGLRTVLLMNKTAGDSALSDLTKLTKVEPLVVISKELMGLEVMPSVLNGLLSFTIADYLQAVDILGKVKDVELIRQLEKLNPDRDAQGSLMILTAETRANKFSLGTDTRVATMEAKGPIDEEAVNLAVGKLVDVDFTFNVGPEKEQRTTKLKIAFRLMPRFVSNTSVVKLLGWGTDDTSFGARKERADYGGIRPFIDFILCQDLIEEARKAAFNDDTQILNMIMERVAQNKKYGLITMNPSLVTLSNIFIITEAERIQLEAKFGGKLETKGVRDRVFQNVSASTLVIVDRQYNNVVFWKKGASGSSTFSFKELKNSSNGKGPDIMDMLKGFNMGMPISL